MQDWEQCHKNVPGIPRHRTERFTGLNLLEDTFNVIQNWETDALQFYLMILNYFLLAVMVEGAG